MFLHSWSKEFEEEIVETYRPRRYLFEDQIDFYQNNIRLNAIKSRWYSTKAVMKLKSQCEDENNFKYDFVMVYRFDHIFLSDLIFPDFDTNYFYAAHRDDCASNQCRCIITNRFYDAWFFGNSEDMDKYSSLYDFWEDYGIWDPPNVTGHEARWIRWYEWAWDESPPHWRFVDFERVHEACWRRHTPPDQPAALSIVAHAYILNPI